MTFMVTLPGGRQITECRSCFVVEIDGLWCLVTAGHVVRTLRSYITSGCKISSIDLQDKFAGGGFSMGVPLGAHSIDEWTWFHRPSMDYAFLPLESLTAQALERGGVTAIDARAWGELSAYDAIFVTGVPSETFTRVGKAHLSMALVFVPLELTDRPRDDWSEDTDIRYARVKDELDVDKIDLKNMDGMSGGPVFGFRNLAEGGIKYWLIGIQSGWFASRRLATFYPVRPFLEATGYAIDKLIERLE